jgi:hypothetical protein
MVTTTVVILDTFILLVFFLANYRLTRNLYLGPELSDILDDQANCTTLCTHTSQFLVMSLSLGDPRR